MTELLGLGIVLSVIGSILFSINEHNHSKATHALLLFSLTGILIAAFCSVTRVGYWSCQNYQTICGFAEWCKNNISPLFYEDYRSTILFVTFGSAIYALFASLFLLVRGLRGNKTAPTTIALISLILGALIAMIGIVTS